MRMMNKKSPLRVDSRGGDLLIFSGFVGADAERRTPYKCVRLYIGAYWFAALYCAGGVESLPFVLLLKARERDICCTADVFVVSRHDQNAVGCAAHCHKNALQSLATLRKRR